MLASGLGSVCKKTLVVSETTDCSVEHSKPQCVDRLRRSNTHSERYCCLRQRIIGVAMMSVRHLAGQTQVCGCQLQSRRVQARTGRRCTTIRAATAVPAEVCKWHFIVVIGLTISIVCGLILMQSLLCYSTRQCHQWVTECTSRSTSAKRRHRQDCYYLSQHRKNPHKERL